MSTSRDDSIGTIFYLSPTSKVEAQQATLSEDNRFMEYHFCDANEATRFLAWAKKFSGEREMKSIERREIHTLIITHLSKISIIKLLTKEALFLTSRSLDNAMKTSLEAKNPAQPSDWKPFQGKFFKLSDSLETSQHYVYSLENPAGPRR